MHDFIDNLVEFYEKLSSWEQEVAKESTLSLPQLHTVEVIGSAGEIRMKELAEKLGITTGSLTVMIQRLEALNMVERKQSEKDKRSYSLSLTEAGNTEHEQHHRLHDELAGDIASNLTEDEVTQFTTLLSKILQNF